MGNMGEISTAASWYAGKIAKWPHLCATLAAPPEGGGGSCGGRELGGWILCQCSVKHWMGCATQTTSPVAGSCLAVGRRMVLWFSQVVCCTPSSWAVARVSWCCGGPSTRNSALILLKNLYAFVDLVATELVQESSILGCKKRFPGCEGALEVGLF